jgi:hypothetical protein
MGSYVRHPAGPVRVGTSGYSYAEWAEAGCSPSWSGAASRSWRWARRRCPASFPGLTWSPIRSFSTSASTAATPGLALGRAPETVRLGLPRRGAARMDGRPHPAHGRPRRPGGDLLQQPCPRTGAAQCRPARSAARGGRVRSPISALRFASHSLRRTGSTPRAPWPWASSAAAGYGHLRGNKGLMPAWRFPACGGKGAASRIEYQVSRIRHPLWTAASSI